MPVVANEAGFLAQQPGLSINKVVKILYHKSKKEGGVKVCGDAVLRYFWRGFAEIFILTCGISVLLDYAVCGVKKVWVTVIGDHEVSAVFWDPLICFFSVCLSKPSVSTISRCNSRHSQGPLLHKQALRFLVVDLVGLAAFCIISNDTSTGDLRVGCPVIDLLPTCSTISAMPSEQDEEEVTINCVAIFL